MHPFFGRAAKKPRVDDSEPESDAGDAVVLRKDVVLAHDKSMAAQKEERKRMEAQLANTSVGFLKQKATLKTTIEGRLKKLEGAKGVGKTLKNTMKKIDAKED